MQKQFFSRLGRLMIFLALVLGNAIPVYAQSGLDVGIITLAELGEGEIYLDGPYDTFTVTFGLPATWHITAGTQINLDLMSIFGAGEEGGADVFGGTLTVKFNRDTIAILPINFAGTFEYNIPLPLSNLISPRSDGRMELRFELDSGLTCVPDKDMDLVVKSSSGISFSYEEKSPDIDLINFPRPIFQGTIFPDKTLIVVPDQATSMEMQSALTVASGLANLTSSRLTMELTTASQITAEQQATNDLIIIGKAESLPLLNTLDLPLANQSGDYQLSGDLNDGVIQMVNSPWSSQDVVLIVSGNTDAGVFKAAQAVSTGIVQPNSSANLAIVKSVQDIIPQTLPLIEQTLADMGFNEIIIDDRGVNSTEFSFFMPPGNVLSSDAYFELAYGHSALLNYDVSGLVVLLNDKPIASIQFTPETAREAINRVRFTLPPSVVLPGNNWVEIRSSLEPIDYCTDPNLRSLWTVIWPESNLYLPLSPLPTDIPSVFDLSMYPAPITLNSTLENTAFIVSKQDVNAWRSAIKVAGYLGDSSNGEIFRPTVIFDEEHSTVDLTKYNLVVIGRPSQLTIMDELNKSLPVSFEKGADQVLGNYSQVTYRIPLNVPLGYVELLPSPWNSDFVVIAALGNTTEGVNWAVSALYETPLRGRLAGNIAVINNSRVQTFDTRIGIQLDDEAIEAMEPIFPESVPDLLAEPTAGRPEWILIALQIVGGLILFIIILTFWGNWRRSKSR